MRVLVALGGNALLTRGEPMTAAAQRANIKVATSALAPLVQHHELVLSHGNGPQVGLLALQAAAYEDVEPYPLDVLGAETEGMIGYMIEQELGNLLPVDVPIATLLTMIQVDVDDPAFQAPTKFVGPVYSPEKALELAVTKPWTFKPDGEYMRRVVASPEPRRIFEIQPIRWLLEHKTVVICSGGGGIPTAYAHGDSGELRGVEAVIDKDFASELLAREIEADVFVMATDVNGIYEGWGSPHQRLLDVVTPAELRSMELPKGSMGPKAEAAMRFVEHTGKRAAIGSLEDIEKVVDGAAGTNVVPDPSHDPSKSYARRRRDE